MGTADDGYAAEELELSRLAKALGHPARVRILRVLLSNETCSGGEIFDDLPLAQSTISEHLRVLRQSGLIGYESRGARGCYWAEREVLRRAARAIETMLSEAASVDHRCDGADRGEDEKGS